MINNGLGDRVHFVMCAIISLKDTVFILTSDSTVVEVKVNWKKNLI